jgi:hypothetical protein
LLDRGVRHGVAPVDAGHGDQDVAEKRPFPSVSWDRQSLADFEARPVTELAKGYDVMIVDHPGLGAAIAAGAVQPLRRLVPREVLDERKATSFVPIWDSYVVGGQPWALPPEGAGEVAAFLTAFWTAEAQAGLVPAHAGQSAHVAAWDSPRVDRDWGGYYSSTRWSLAAAWIRPRDDGWIGLQGRAGVLVREAVTGAADAAAVVAAINDDYRMLKGGTP